MTTSPSPPADEQPVEQPVEQRAEQPADPAPVWSVALDYGLRLVCVALVVWVAWQAVPILARIYRGASLPEKDQVAKSPDPTAAPQILAAAPLPGPWRFAGSEWQYAISKVPAKDVDERLSRLAEKPVAAPQVAETKSRDFLQALRVIASSAPLSGGRHQYQAAGQNWKITVIAIGEGDRETILTGAAAWRYGPGDWQWLELVPSGTGPAANAPRVVEKAEHLLPLPPRAAVVASRSSNAGELLLEVVSTPLPFSEFRALWEQAGYRLHRARGSEPPESLVPPEARPSPDRGAPEEPIAASAIKPRPEAWFCVRGDDVVYVWTTTAATHSTLLLARTSAADSASESPSESPSPPPRESTP